MKKILSLVLAIMMVLSMASTAFAGTFEDVSDADQAKAIDAIAALGIINGYDDGTYKPEKVVTRAEMAKILIVALGYESIANDTPAFSDSQNHWAKGFIALASDLGVVNGRGNGIFDPDATVTYQEAAVMMLRALGYTDKAVNNGKSEAYNAGNYKTKALALGLFSDLSAFSFNNGANRGDIALMLFANLTNDMVEINPTTGLAQPIEKGVQTLISKLATVTNVNVTAKLVKDNTALNLADYLNYDLEVYMNDANQIVYVSKVLNKTYTGTFAANADSKKVNLVISKTETKALALSDADAVNVITNGVSSTIAEAALEANGAAKVIMTAGDNPTIKVAIFEKVSPAIQAKAKYATGRTVYEGIVLPKTSAGKVDESKITVVGDAASLSDIEVNDVIQAVKASDNSVLKLYVTRNTVEGKISKIDAAGDVYIDGVAYETIATLALGNEGTFYLDKDGVIAFYSTSTPSTPVKYAIVSSIIANGKIDTDEFTGVKSVVTYPRIKMIGLDAKETVYELAVKLDDSKNVITNSVVGVTLTSNLASNTLDVASTDNDLENTANYLVKYTLDSKGRITKLEAVDVTKATLKTSNINFLANANTVVLNYNKADDEYSVVTLADLDAEISYFAVGSSAFAWDLLIAVDGITVEQDNEYAVVLSIGKTYAADGKTPVDEVTAFVNGEKVTLLTNAKDTITTVNEVLKLTMENGIIVAKAAAPTIGSVNTTAAAIVGNRISLAGGSVSYRLAENVAVYQEGTTTFTLSDISNIITTETKVTLYQNAAGEVVIIVINK